MLSTALRAETDATVVGVDADAELLVAARRGHAHTASEETGHHESATGPFPVLQGDALTLPVRDDAVDLAACQALLINLPDPAAGI